MENLAQFSELIVDTYTTPCPVCVNKRQGIDEVLSLMKENGVRHIPVVDTQEEVCGIVSQRDIQAISSFRFSEHITVGDVMIQDPLTVRAGSLLMDSAYTMSEEKVGSLLVLNQDGSLNGIFTTTDALNALIEVLRGEVLS